MVNAITVVAPVFHRLLGAGENEELGYHDLWLIDGWNAPGDPRLHTSSHPRATHQVERLMQYFWDWAVKPLLLDRGVRHVLEIGASLGGNTDRILRNIPGARVSVIDPCLDTDLSRKYRDVEGVTVHVGRSLDVLPNLRGCFEAVLIDGDHNYYTVVNELKAIKERQLLASGGMILLHDVGKPWARRDLYYEPERIPDHAKQPSAPHGVLTAVEEFVDEAPERWICLKWRAEHGLACLVDRRSQSGGLRLRLKCFLWRSIRWRYRLERLTGLRPADHIAWGKEPGR
jgi:hypothetical protein